MEAIDFGKSFVTWKLDGGLYGRFKVEAACAVTRGNAQRTWYLLSGVMACNVLRGADMIHEPGYIFQALFSENDFKIFRINNAFGDKKDTTGLNAQRFESISSHIKTVSPTLVPHDQVCKATLANLDLAAWVLIEGKEHTCLLSFPVKHINAKPERQVWQVETGPVLMPASQKGTPSAAAHFAPAYVALNSLGHFDHAVLANESWPRSNSRFFRKQQPLKVRSSIYTIQ